MSKDPIMKKPACSESRIIRIQQVMHLTGLSRSYLYALTAKGEFPKSVTLIPGGSSKGWVEAEIHEWVDQRISDRDMEAHNA